jgi:hypothetical protein
VFLQPDIIATDSKVRKPFQWRGNLMVVVSTAGNGCVEQADAYRLTRSACSRELQRPTGTRPLQKTGRRSA